MPYQLIRLCFTVAAVAATFLFATAQGQPPTASPAKKAAAVPRTSKPAWNELTPAQKEALAPLAQDWNSFDSDRKQKWLTVARRYPQLTPDGQAHLHQRMAEFVKLSPEQRRNVRENFRKAYELPLDQRQALIQEYKDLPPERKRELSDKAKARSSAGAAPRALRENRHPAEQKKSESR